MEITTKYTKNVLIFSYLVLILLIISVYPNDIYANDSIELTGDILKIAIPATAYAMTFYYNDHEGRIEFYKSFLTTLGVTYILKYFIHETSPNGGPGSFPSGHTSIAFSGASFIQRRYGWRFGIPAYIAAAFVGWSRIESKNHYWKDVLAGSTIGITATFVFADKYKRGIIISPLCP